MMPPQKWRHVIALTSLCELFAFQLTPRDIPDSMSAKMQNKVLKNKDKTKSLIGKLLQYTHPARAQCRMNIFKP
jgi:hypothetical protein